jgi:hypothetical protein
MALPRTNSAKITAFAAKYLHPSLSAGADRDERR